MMPSKIVEVPEEAYPLVMERSAEVVRLTEEQAKILADYQAEQAALQAKWDAVANACFAKVADAKNAFDKRMCALLKLPYNAEGKYVMDATYYEQGFVAFHVYDPLPKPVLN